MLARFRCNGVILDQEPVDVDANYWTEAANMVAKPNRMERARGYAEVFASPIAQPYWLMYAEQLGEPYWFYGGGSNGVVVDRANTHTVIWPAVTPTQGTGDWSGGLLNGIAIVNAFGAWGRYWYQGLGNALDLPGQREILVDGAPTGTFYRYGRMRTHRNHIFGLGVYGDTRDEPDSVHWSDAAPPGAAPQTWVPTTENEAGDAVLADDGGAIVDGKTLRDSFIIYKRDSVWEASYIGGQAVYSFRKVFANTGVLAPNCVVRVKGTHVVLGNGDIYQHDGQNIKSIVDGKLRRAFFGSINSANQRNSFVVYNEPEEEVWFCAPRTGQVNPDLALVWDVVTGEFGYRELPTVNHAATGIVSETAEKLTWADQTQAWNETTRQWNSGDFDLVEESVLIADAGAGGGRLLLGNSGLTAGGVAYDSSVAKLSMDLGSTRVKAIRRIWPHIDSPDNAVFTLELFDQESPHTGQTVKLVRDFAPGPEGVPVSVNCRYLGVRISTVQTMEWGCRGFDVEFEERGNF